MVRWLIGVVWPGLAIASTGMLLVTTQRADALAEQVKLLRRLDALQRQHCEGVAKVNQVCADQLVDVLQRLGVDDQILPVVTTALWRRFAAGKSVETVRRLYPERAGAASGLLGDVDVLADD